MTATVVTTATGGIALDYSVYLDTLTNTATNYAPYLDRIAASLETLATNSISIAASVASVASNFTTITNLSTGTGIHTVKAHDWLGVAALYRLFVEQGKILDTSTYVSTSTQTVALAELETYVQKFNNLPTNF